MLPKQALSAAAQVVAEMSRQLRATKRMAREDVETFTKLLSAYGSAVEAANKEPLGAKDVDDIMQVGIPGAYEAMEQRTRQRVVGPAKHRTHK